ncbi:acyl carrier protein [Actinoplanes sp. NPDC049265]|uniref:acyl carrier protein n=1 Tax=Actinoplanes sp. NPDC049265 TaxID=3363902 RepID=UPI003711AC50
MTDKVAALREWVAGLHEQPVDIAADTDLINAGLLTSLQFVQMVIEIERLHGRKLDPAVITISSMRSLAAIDQSVFQAA